MLLKCLPSGDNAQTRVNPDIPFFLCAPLVEDAIAGYPLNHLDTIMLENTHTDTYTRAHNFYPHYVQLSSCLQVLFIRKAAGLGNKPKKIINVSINASKETCVANGFSETIGSEGVTLHSIDVA